MRITVYGSGSWGTALACMLSRNGHTVNIWGWLKEQVDEINEKRENPLLPGVKLPDDMIVSCDYSLGKDAELVVFAVPSGAVKNVAQAAAPHIPADAMLVNVAKGFFPGTLQRLSQVLAESFPNRPILTLSGPSHAEEAGKGMATTVVIAGGDAQLRSKAQDIFMNSTFRVYPNADQLGVEVGGAVKNVIALASGIADGLGLGDNAKAALMTRGLAEMKRLGVAMGAEPATFSGLAGLGDMVVTCTSIHSRNYRAGRQIGQGKPWKEILAETEMVVEGVYATDCTYELAKKLNVEMPITEQLYKVLYEDVTPADAMAALLTRARSDKE